jgi:predicted lipoprotein with Yx(FWY)xxD motif
MEDSMKTPAILLAGAAVALTACDSMYAPAPPPGAIVPAATATITTATKPPFGTYLVDGAGRALYILEGTRGASAERCSGRCLAVWPPLHVGAPPTAAAGIDPARLSTIMAHGHTHVTYGGWTLFYYHRDRAPGDTTGQHVKDAWGTWHLISPSGEPIRPVSSRVY